jgi:hypothetical protein
MPRRTSAALDATRPDSNGAGCHSVIYLEGAHDVRRLHNRFSRRHCALTSGTTRYDAGRPSAPGALHVTTRQQGVSTEQVSISIAGMGTASHDPHTSTVTSGTLRIACVEDDIAPSSRRSMPAPDVNSPACTAS